MAQERQGQTVPVRLYQTVDHFMLVAPMPGLEPGNIFVVIDSIHVTVRGEERGPRQHELNLLIEEWAFGPYYREVLLPQPVNADLCNATYGNGVLTLSMPKLVAAKDPNYAAFGLVAVTSTFGERVGHSGHNIQATTTREHQQKVDRTAGCES